jgi:amphiphysin
MQEKIQSFADGKYDLERKDVEGVYFEQRGQVAEQIDELQITKRIASTGESR